MAISEETEMKNALAALRFDSVGRCSHDDGPLVISKAVYL